MPRKTLAYFLAISSQPLAISISSSKIFFLDIVKPENMFTL